MGDRVSTSLPRLDELLGGGLLPGTLAVVYGATGIGKTHLGLTFAHHGLRADSVPGLVADLNGRGDSQQHAEYAQRLFGWRLTPWRHTVIPMSDPFPPAEELEHHLLDALDWTGKVSDYQVASPDGREFDWSWKAAYARRLDTVRPFFYFHFCQGSRRVVVDGVEPADAPDNSIQLYLFDDLYRTILHRDSEILGMEICLPVWRHRKFIDAHRYDHRQITTLLMVTAEETLLDDLIAKRMGAGDIGAVANTIILMGRRTVGDRVGRFLHVAKHRGSAASDAIVEYQITEAGLTFP